MLCIVCPHKAVGRQSFIDKRLLFIFSSDHGSSNSLIDDQIMIYIQIQGSWARFLHFRYLEWWSNAVIVLVKYARTWYSPVSFKTCSTQNWSTRWEIALWKLHSVLERQRNKVAVDVCQTCTCDLYISRVKRQMEEKEAEYVCGSHISYFTVLKNGH